VFVCSALLLPARVIAATKGILASDTTSINGISLTSTKNELLMLLGSPNLVENGKFSLLNDELYETFYYDGYRAFFVGEVLYGFDCSLQNCKTNMNIGIGDVASKVISVYGVGSRETNDTGSMVVSYKLKDVNSSLIFLFDTENVSHIRLFHHLR
jgi:hypothetical protein